MSLARRRGFTLIELLVVIVVIAILALIVIPKVMGAGRKAKEATLKGILHQLRTAIEQFQSDCGCYPTNLSDIVQTDATQITDGVDEAGTGVPIPTGSYKGPYLSPQGGVANAGIPINPFITDAATADDAWTYSNGIVKCPDTIEGNTLDTDTPYQEL
jgi:type II secretion system protein G